MFCHKFIHTLAHRHITEAFFLFIEQSSHSDIFGETIKFNCTLGCCSQIIKRVFIVDDLSIA
ncbi:MAG: hypothetical protein IJS03_01605 [Eubacterium sp.]|nr:hypothetical protein [Eubacterium sp.]